MSKIEEITEILVNEIESFEKDISKLETISDKLSNAKINIDLKEYKLIIESHQQRMNEIVNSQERFLNRFERLLKKAKIYPNWVVIAFIGMLLLMFGSLFFIYKSNQKISEIEKTAYQKGLMEYKGWINTFFDNNSKSKKTFE